MIAADARTLFAEAIGAREGAYAPYSGFAVGAALLDEDGRVHRGANVENAAYPLSTCAERVAVTVAVAGGARHFRAIAVAGPPGGAVVPCGACRQILHEFAPGIEVVVADGAGGVRVVSLAALLPDAFGAETLGGLASAEGTG